MGEIWELVALELAQMHNPMLAEQIAQQILMSGGQPIPTGGVADVEMGQQEHPYVEKSREQARASTQAE